MKRYVGRVKFFDDIKGFGFVNCWFGNQDYFVHISKTLNWPGDGDFVIFNLVLSRKKPGTLEVANLQLVSKFKDDNISDITPLAELKNTVWGLFTR